MFTAIVLAVAIQHHGHARHHRPPKWIDGSLANMWIGHEAALYDPTTGYMYLGSAGCGGGSGHSMLTRDRYEALRRGYQAPGFKPRHDTDGAAMTVARIHSLSSGKRVAIGDTTSQVWRRLGRPTLVKRTGRRKQFLAYVYKWRSGNRDEDMNYEQVYVFKQGKLIEMELGYVANLTG